MDEVEAHPSSPLFPGLTTGQHYSSLFDKDYSLLPPPPPPPSADLPLEPPCGFMELLGHQSFESFSSLLDGMSDQMITPTTLGPWNCFKGGGGGGAAASSNVESATTPTANNTSSAFLEASTPNSSTISSASNDELQAVLDPDNTHVKEEEDLYLDQDPDQDQHPPNNTCTKMPLKPKKANQKKKQQREKEARFAFMTKSEVDHLEDGYRWRKYGQKAVKNSPFPRSYYRCTSTSCNVKKRVERCFNDPSIVITTYEGQHTHPSPNMARSVGFPVTRFLTDPAPTTGPCALSDQRGSSAPTLSSYSLLHGNYVNGCSPTLNFNQSSTSAPAFQSSFVQGRRFCNPSGGAVSRENGLLQDIVPSHVYDAK